MCTIVAWLTPNCRWSRVKKNCRCNKYDAITWLPQNTVHEQGDGQFSFVLTES
uniref:Uncharacterized protein n=1 Tax=Arundo donax TaxID=35708 RepID=A0A0A9A2K2_ARUDO